MKDIKLSEIIPPHFHEAHRFIKNHDYTEFVFPGGRGSCKSSFVGEEIPLLIKQNPDMHCLVLRKYQNTLKDSVFNQLLWAIDMLGLSSEFRCPVSPKDLIICDSSEEKSVADYRAYGLFARGAEKDPGSVDYSMKWLQSLREIVIDKKRCPETYKEFTEYEYERSKSGEIISGYPDKNNHSIDAVRYATSNIWMRGGK